MRSSKNILITLAILIIVAALYRVIPNRPMGFAPHLAMALFGGAVLQDKKLAFALPIFSMFISDLLYHLLYISGLTTLSGFYDGQLTNYMLFAGMTLIGFLMKKISVLNIALFSVLIASAYFLLSNFFVWNAGAGWSRPHNFAGLMLTYEDGLPFFRNSIYATLMFSGVLFGAWKLFTSDRKAVAV